MTHLTLPGSRWLVGSSSSRMSAFISIARVSATFMRQPPERRPTSFWSDAAGIVPSGSTASVSAKPTAISFSRAICSVTPYFFRPAWFATKSSTDSSVSSRSSLGSSGATSPCTSVSTNIVRSSEGGGNPSTCWSAMARMRVVLPESFLPHRPYRYPRFSLSTVWLSSTLLPYASENLQSHSCSASSTSSLASSTLTRVEQASRSLEMTPPVLAAGITAESSGPRLADQSPATMFLSASIELATDAT
mmetsp:Transcript_44855/g.124384  ORF Transcript_44855/g.124384 Transcript_44855/m.124384 type:complete len:247 (-) Transcript_44855:1064-1804(-)